MTERRKRKHGNSPTGRDARSVGRRTDRAKRSPSSKSTLDGAKTNRLGFISRRRKGGKKPERTILGLSTTRAVILAIVVCALALTLTVPLRTYFSQRSEASKLAAERSELQSQIQHLRDRQAQQQDPAYIEAEARQRLRLVMPGETPYQVQLPGAYEAEQAALAKPKPKGGPWYSDLWKQVSRPQSDPVTIPAPAPAPPPPPPPPPAPAGAGQ
ncbi:septum formation initiator family protein [Skermania sp. ID1734]|uniref:FtsB family cell division protein n=1 Tax=Skermania sp. ID1734 TaxID=2597516 RepID=UPI0011817003|nr:septum formation initiator family protein [Skermania sp. ID1734]TSD99782.1 septum formation initiator family protein [Skermania sp. ID1734]